MMIKQGKPKKVGETPAPLAICTPQIPLYYKYTRISLYLRVT
jgi:hypothetical protein